MKVFTEPTIQIYIYMAGDIDTAKAACRQYCFDKGLCVTATHTDFIYTGGHEFGIQVGLVNYPRFPTNEENLTSTALELANLLITKCCQWTALVVTPTNTHWLSRRES